MLSLSSLAGLRSKKKFHFDVSFSLQDLVNCTYVTGVIFTKLRLKDGGNFTEVSRRYDSHRLSLYRGKVQFRKPDSDVNYLNSANRFH